MPRSSKLQRLATLNQTNSYHKNVQAQTKDFLYLPAKN